jgi:uncharacterized protein YjgD (DUF1641 family)
MLNGEFEKLLVDAVDESLSSLGESPKQAIFFHLENTFKIKKQEIPGKIASFDQALRKLFELGADFLETLIVKKLCEKADSIFKESPPKETGFTETIASIKRLMVT